MRAVDVLETLELLGSSQWGLVTTAQAKAAGVSNVQLQRLARHGTLSRARHGVYALPSAGVDPLQDLRAAWLAAAVDGAETVVAGVSAAAVHGLGDLVPAHHEFASSVRRQSSLPDVRFRRAKLSSTDVAVVDGLPVTTVSRTVSDLARRSVDSGHLAGVLSDAVVREGADLKRLAAALNPSAHKYFAKSGADLLFELAAPSASFEAVAEQLVHALTVDFSDQERRNLVRLVLDSSDGYALEEGLGALFPRKHSVAV